jgi:hypothetical protein
MFVGGEAQSDEMALAFSSFQFRPACPNHKLLYNIK